MEVLSPPDPPWRRLGAPCRRDGSLLGTVPGVPWNVYHTLVLETWGQTVCVSRSAHVHFREYQWQGNRKTRSFQDHHTLL